MLRPRAGCAFLKSVNGAFVVCKRKKTKKIRGRYRVSVVVVCREWARARGCSVRHREGGES